MTNIRRPGFPAVEPQTEPAATTTKPSEKGESPLVFLIQVIFALAMAYAVWVYLTPDTKPKPITKLEHQSCMIMYGHECRDAFEAFTATVSLAGAYEEAQRAIVRKQQNSE